MLRLGYQKEIGKMEFKLLISLNLKYPETIRIRRLI